MDIGGSNGGGSGSGGRGIGVALALLGSRRGWAADVSARTACLQPRPAGGGQQRSLCLACVGVGPLTSEVQNKTIIMGHQILSYHVLVVRSFFIL